jgi:hypothetical protein
MKKFSVMLNAHASCYYEIEAETPFEAQAKVMQKIAKLSDAEGGEWCWEDLGEVEDLSTGETFTINELEG